MTSDLQHYALVTGAASGIGRAFAFELAKQGLNLVLVDQNQNLLKEASTKLAETFDIDVLQLEEDLSDPESPKRIHEFTITHNLNVTYLINNAGFCLPNNFMDYPWERHAQAIQVMSTTVAHLTHLFLPSMIEKNFGRIIIPSSLSALSPGTPSDTLYESVKAFCLKFAESLNFELEDYNIHITAICPGYTRTRFHDLPGLETMKTKIPDWAWMDPEEVAKESLLALEKGKVRCVNGFLYKLIGMLFEYLPYSLFLYTTKIRRKVRQGK
jgi:short-subunit dehydrogenase